jgi:hypothetical protein
MRTFYAFLLTLAVILTTAAFCRPVSAHSLRASGPETASGDAPYLRLPDPNKELRHLSKNLKLKKDQKAGVSSILQERSREIRLLLDMESLSQEYRNRLAAKVMKDSDSEIETLLKSDQKRKFDKELARDQDTH